MKGPPPKPSLFTAPILAQVGGASTFPNAPARLAQFVAVSAHGPA